MELVFNPTRKVTTADLQITCDPALEFEVRVSVPRPVRRLMVQFEEGGYTDTGLACEIIGKSFVSVGQNGHSYLLDNKEAAEGLRQATGDDFVLALVDGFISNHYSFFLKDKIDSED